MIDGAMDWLAAHYLWLKAGHVISVMAWMAGLLYLPRLFVYHADAAPGSELSETFKVMERRLLRAIMNPAMIAAFVFGGLMLASGVPDYEAAWLYVKLAFIAGLTWLHHVFALWRKAFAEDRNRRSARSYRVWNEIPALAMVVIVVMAVVEPF